MRFHPLCRPSQEESHLAAFRCGGIRTEIFVPWHPFHHRVLERSPERALEGRRIRIHAAGDLIIFKKIFDRPKDIADIKADPPLAEGQARPPAAQVRRDGASLRGEPPRTGCADLRARRAGHDGKPLRLSRRGIHPAHLPSGRSPCPAPVRRSSPRAGTFRVPFSPPRQLCRLHDRRSRAYHGRTTSERELVARARTGDCGAFEALYLAHRDALAARLERKLGERVREESSLEDLLQETFLRALGLIDRFEWRGEGSVLRWLAAIGEHLILNAAQKAARAPLKLDIGPEREPRDPGVSPSRAARREERFARLERALEGLSPAEREAILAMRIDGLSLEEAARRLGKSPEAVKKAVTRALARLRERLGDTESFHLPARRIGRAGPPAEGSPP